MDVKLHLPAGAQAASETDLMERPMTEIFITNGTVTVHTKPYEIKTVQIRFAPKSPEQTIERSAN
jgi:alpha-mannosidase